MNKTTIVISHYSKRDKYDLKNLLNELMKFNANIVVTINDDTAISDTIYDTSGIRFIIRPNIGMNIGGWSAALKYCKDFDQIIFLQDECRVNDSEFIDAYAEKLNDPLVGMIGESLNYKWNLKWANLLASNLNYNINLPNGKKNNRVSFYLEFMNKLNIKPGSTGLHLRALAWGFSSRIITNNISKFPEGTFKEECIASEISVTKMIEQTGLKVCQSDLQPFKFFTHNEWKIDGSEKIHCNPRL